MNLCRRLEPNPSAGCLPLPAASFHQFNHTCWHLVFLTEPERAGLQAVVVCLRFPTVAARLAGVETHVCELQLVPSPSAALEPVNHRVVNAMTNAFAVQNGKQIFHILCDSRA